MTEVAGQDERGLLQLRRQPGGGGGRGDLLMVAEEVNVAGADVQEVVEVGNSQREGDLGTRLKGQD